MTDNGTQKEIGYLKATVEAHGALLESQGKQLGHIRDDVAVIRSAVDEAKGRWKVLFAVGGIAGIGGALADRVAGWLHILPK